jgi:hypothetical protein
MSGAKALSGSGKDDNADFVIVRGADKGVIHFFTHKPALGIHVAWSIKYDAGYPPRLIDDVFIVHIFPPSVRFNKKALCAICYCHEM